LKTSLKRHIRPCADRFETAKKLVKISQEVASRLHFAGRLSDEIGNEGALGCNNIVERYYPY
jgi:hypothetical protein